MHILFYIFHNTLLHNILYKNDHLKKNPRFFSRGHFVFVKIFVKTIRCTVKDRERGQDQKYTVGHKTSSTIQRNLHISCMGTYLSFSPYLTFINQTIWGGEVMKLTCMVMLRGHSIG